MADDIDSGVDKRRILDEIGASAPLPEPPRPAPAPAPPQMRELPLMSLSAMAPPTLPVDASPAPAPEAVHRPKTRWERHRRHIAALVLVFVSLLWFGVGLATQERAPFAIGGGVLGLAVLIGVGTLVRDT